MANLRFYMTPGSCSTGIHILLEETGPLFEVYPVNLMAGDQFKPEYLAINPNGSVPTLVREDGSALITYQSIARWLAETYPRSRLQPEDEQGRARVMAMMDHAVQVLHGEGFARIFTTERFITEQNGTEAVLAQGRDIIAQAFAVADRELAGREYLAEHFSIADSALFYVEFWADRTDTPLPENCRAHYERVLQRPAVRQVLMEEGYGRMFAA